MVEDSTLEAPAKDRLRFALKQWIDAMCPANFAATNPEVMRQAIETKGESITLGIANMIADARKGRISMTDESAFEVGRNLAVSPGAVVYENPLIQLIQYSPSTAQVGQRPLVIIPPCINKFYILDLQPENSFVRYAVEQGHTVFMVSWRNVKAEHGHLTWDDYLAQGVIEALRVARAIAGSDRVNALGFCVGGTLLGAALAVLAAKGERPAESVTLLTTMLDFSETGQLGYFVDEANVAAREASIGAGGIFPGADLAFVFSALRANDLIWPYVVNNYLKGRAPDAFDLLYWNSDSTNLPGPMYCYYLRNTYPGEQAADSRRAHELRRAGRSRRHRAPELRIRLARGPHRAVEKRLRLDQTARRRCALRTRCERAHRGGGQSARQEPAQLLGRHRLSGGAGGVARAGAGATRQLVAGLVAVACAIQGRRSRGAHAARQCAASADRTRAGTLREGKSGLMNHHQPQRSFKWKK